MWVGHAFFSKESVFACILLLSLRSLHSYAFFANEPCVLCVLLRSLQMNVAFFAFFYVLVRFDLHRSTLPANFFMYFALCPISNPLTKKKQGVFNMFIN